MRMLFLTYYFPPDLSAGSFRSSAFVDALYRSEAFSGKIDVLTTMPNRYGSYESASESFETVDGADIYRIKVPRHSSNMIGQALAFLFYAWHVWRHCRRRQYDIVFGTSSRMFTAVLAALISKKINAPLFVDVRDIFNDTIVDVVSRPIAIVLSPFLKLSEWFFVRRASRINLVSQGFVSYFEKKYPGIDVAVIPNGIDDEFIGIDFESKPARQDPDRLKILYAGNIGAGQGLDRILPELASIYDDRDFIVIGDGGTRRALEEAITARGITNLILKAPVPREELLEWYRFADVLFLHLNDIPAFEKVLPSKIFEYGATGKPILAGVSGYAREFLKKNVTNCETFSPCDFDDAARAMERLNKARTDRSEFVERFRRSKLMDSLVESVLECAEEK